jgi:hypothetical protein
MAEQKQKQRFSLPGLIVILALAGVTVALVSSGNLLILFTLATTLLVALLIAVAFDLGVGKTGLAVVEEAPEEVEPPALGPAPPVKRRKKRR